MMKWCSLQLYLKICLKIQVFLFCTGFARELEIGLKTQHQKSFVYLTRLHLSSSEYDWRYFDELRDVFQFDLQHNGLMSVVPTNIEWEDAISWSDVRSHFNVKDWRERNIPYVVAVQVVDHRLQVIVFDVQRGSAKKYPDLAMMGKLGVDRGFVHQVTDMIQADLFGVEGIASLKILYSKRYKVNDAWLSEIWVCDSDGANSHPVIADQGYCISPNFFPSSMRLQNHFYYVSFQEGQSKIYSSSLETKEKELFVSLRGSQALPAMSMKGNMIAFITDTAGRPDLFVQSVNAQGKAIGRPRQLFSAPRSTQASPTFSPDGKEIAFVSDRDGPPRVYVMSVLGPKETKKPAMRLLTKKNRENTSPAWSSDGTKIAYSAKVDGVRQIWIYDFETEEERPITSGPANKENPSWAPDNLHLIYNTEDSDVCEMYRIHIEDKEPILIGAGSEQKRFPSWNLSK